MEISTDKLAPRIIINENDIPATEQNERKSPITLIFGFAPVGRLLEMVVWNNSNDISREFGFPSSGPEKYFIDSATRLVETGATAIMTRLPYDNYQCHNVKYVDFKFEKVERISLSIIPPNLPEHLIGLFSTVFTQLQLELLLKKLY